MKLSAIQQEILLVTGTNFLSRQCFESDKTKDQLTEIQQLEEACWNGLIQEMLPEIILPDGEKLFLWQIKEASSFIGIDLCEYPDDKEFSLSIDPYYFLPERIMS